MRRAAKKDAIQAEYVKALRRYGCLVVIADEPVDLWICYRGQWAPVEVKSHGGKLTPQQVRFKDSCRATGAPFYVYREGEPVSTILDQLA